MDDNYRGTPYTSENSIRQIWIQQSASLVI